MEHSGFALKGKEGLRLVYFNELIVFLAIIATVCLYSLDGLDTNCFGRNEGAVTRITNDIMREDNTCILNVQGLFISLTNYIENRISTSRKGGREGFLHVQAFLRI